MFGGEEGAVAAQHRRSDAGADQLGAQVGRLDLVACIEDRIGRGGLDLGDLGSVRALAFLNLGGVGNITWIDPTAPGPESPGALLAFDTGPANAPINDLMRDRLGLAHDENGALAARGEMDEAFIASVLKDPWFDATPPKSLDRNDFNGLIDRLEMLSDADAAATLTAIAAAAVAAAQIHFPAPVTRILVTGGGRHNPTLMSGLRRRIPCPVVPVEDVGLDGDMLEAQAFAFLAVRVLRKMVDEGKMPDIRPDTAFQDFFSGRLGMSMQSTAQLGRYNREIGGRFKLVCGRFPLSAANPRLPAGGNVAMMFTKDRAKQEAAWKFIKYATGPIGGAAMVNATGYMPGTTIPAQREELLGKFYRENPNHLVAIRQQDVINGWYAFPGQNALRITDVINDHLQSVVNKSKGADDALKAMAAAVQPLLPRRAS